MATEKRLIDAEALCFRFEELVRNIEYIDDCVFHIDSIIDEIEGAPTVDAVPVDEIKLHHVIIDNEGVPEVKLQIGDRYFILRTDPVDVREVVHGRWLYDSGSGKHFCSACDENALSFRKDTFGLGEVYEVCLTDYCPNCGADMRERITDEDN